MASDLYRRPLVQVAVAVSLPFVSALLVTRYLFGTICLSAALTVAAKGSRNRNISVGRVVVFSTAAAVGVFILLRLLTALNLSGFFGSTIAARQEIQQEQSGIFGGRVEWGAFIELLKTSPSGYGFSQIPTSSDMEAGKEGMRAIGSVAGGTSVDDVMFGGRIELHSIAWDLWVAMGIVGLALAAVFLILLVRTLVALSIASPLIRSALPMYVTFQGIWNLFSLLFAQIIIISGFRSASRSWFGAIQHASVVPVPRPLRFTCVDLGSGSITVED
ncbi:hypothetical protein [Rhodococcoides corynebacterioides]|uniref:hypothetical protein n=1 Tax=Rhodococcoides corynebacterioides TaxID=53972 RepID=UPI001114C788|nr:hypothetical protein [Rhodococcus corynebacterioides]